MSADFKAWTPLVRELEIQSHPDKITVVEGLLEEVRSVLEFKDDVYGNVMVAVTEAVNNGIHHGNKGDDSRSVFIRCETINPYRLCISVRDEGEGFDPDALDDPTAPENLEKPGGRGVFLMRNLADEIQFLDDGRKVEMTFNI